MLHWSYSLNSPCNITYSFCLFTKNEDVIIDGQTLINEFKCYAYASIFQLLR